MSSDANGHNNCIIFIFVVVETDKSQILQLQIISEATRHVQGLSGGSSWPIMTSSYITSLFLLILILCLIWLTKSYFLKTKTMPHMSKASVNKVTMTIVAVWLEVSSDSGAQLSSTSTKPALQTHCPVFCTHTSFSPGHGSGELTLQDRMCSVKKNKVLEVTSRIDWFN